MSYESIPRDRDELLRELTRLEIEYRVTIPYLMKVAELDKELKYYEEEKLKAQGQSGETEMKSVGCGCLLYLVILGPWIYMGWFVHKWLTAFANYVGFWKFSVGLFISLGIIRFMISAYFDNKKSAKARAISLEINDNIRDIKKLVDAIPNNFLPDPFKSYVAVTGMIDLVNDYRADSLKEAMNLFKQETMLDSILTGIDELRADMIVSQLMTLQAIRAAKEAADEANQAKWEGRFRNSK